MKIIDISEDIYQYVNKVSLERDSIKDLVEYVHYKAILDIFTFFIETNKNSNLDYLLLDYVEVISKLQSIFNKINNKHEKEDPNI